ncbi:putative acyl-CoA synthetase YngI [Virgibacillus pantothenticus]|uniref:AMP-binding protein n=1 Tax=Virgibacillus pantothenticus TaxID=1473 RepID=A0A0L0QNX6_VIRPA|nr:AMP-binding protein [Virgibacillus pantothenticus]KNE20292.1 AMP-binding protein [Virgibacillus pantothenticus]MBU8568073.1 AMP-binding protein [Virgibacillus pantothenticus]MBU8602019.1 AMP-binding protein [Virgibacillus pantothenticus]MBU8636269.1 AMP-binding protein [Virgibacillus pantothenticus]MBU8643789.1 AMP-binding protein [Virgibacillus pantothenticus]
MSLLHVTVGELLEEQVKLYPEHEAVVYPELKLRKTYQEFNKEVNQAAKGLMALGVGKGEHVAIWSDNKPEWLTTQFATGKMGAVLVTVNTNYQASELQYLLEQSEATTLIMAENYKGTSYIEVLKSICPELEEAAPGNLQSKALPKLKNIIILGNTNYPFAYSWRDIMDAGKEISDQDLWERKTILEEHEVINMQYTSGTTGFPKGVMLTHHNIVNNGKQIADCMKLTEADRLCIPVPFFHCFGCVLGVLAAVSKGTTMVLVEQFHPEKVLAAVAQERCTALHGVPTMFIAELNHPNFEQYDLSSLRTGIMSGSPCPMEVMTKVMEKMGAEEITIAYGQTEASPVITQTKTDDPIELRVSTVGTPHPNVEVKIVIPGTSEEQERGVPGELLTRGYHVMKGYYNNPEATELAIDEDGWLHTGDLALMRLDGYLEITGRMKDMIIRGGENIYPREIEEFLYQHPDVLDVQIVGIPDKKYGEEIMAWIIPKENSQVSEADIRSFCEGNISWHKIPKYIAFVDKYPMTASGKIQKYRLKEMAIQKLNE